MNSDSPKSGFRHQLSRDLKGSNIRYLPLFLLLYVLTSFATHIPLFYYIMISAYFLSLSLTFLFYRNKAVCALFGILTFLIIQWVPADISNSMSDIYSFSFAMYLIITVTSVIFSAFAALRICTFFRDFYQDTPEHIKTRNQAYTFSRNQAYAFSILFLNASFILLYALSLMERPDYLVWSTTRIFWLTYVICTDIYVICASIPLFDTYEDFYAMLVRYLKPLRYEFSSTVFSALLMLFMNFSIQGTTLLILISFAKIYSNFIDIIKKQSSAPSGIAKFFQTLYYVAGVILLYAFIYYRSGLSDSNKDNINEFWASLYFSVVTWTTLGYGDLLPVTPTSRIFAASEVVSGYIVMTLMISSLISLVTLDKKESADIK